MYGSEIELAERRKLNWRAIAAGALAALGIGVFMFYLGGAFGISSFHYTLDPQTPALGPALYMLASALIASFVGAWIAGHWANLYSAEDAYLHGLVTWALCAVVFGAGLKPLLEWGANPVQPAPLNAMDRIAYDRIAHADAYNMLDDPAFLDEVSKRAQEYSVKLEPEPLNASTETLSPLPAHVAASSELRRFVMAQTRMSAKQAQDFLTSEQQTIADEQARSQATWEHTHARVTAQAETRRKAAMIVSGSMALLAAMSLGFSVAGSYLGWRQRYVKFETE